MELVAWSRKLEKFDIRVMARETYTRIQANYRTRMSSWGNVHSSPGRSGAVRVCHTYTLSYR